MAKEYFNKLEELVEALELAAEMDSSFEIKHFFSGAALYVNKSICVSWSPMGLAFKLPEVDVARLINSGEAQPLRYFERGHVKKGYALFDRPNEIESDTCRGYFLRAAQEAVNPSSL